MSESLGRPFISTTSPSTSSPSPASRCKTLLSAKTPPLVEPVIRADSVHATLRASSALAPPGRVRHHQLRSPQRQPRPQRRRPLELRNHPAPRRSQPTPHPPRSRRRPRSALPLHRSHRRAPQHQDRTTKKSPSRSPKPTSPSGSHRRSSGASASKPNPRAPTAVLTTPARFLSKARSTARLPWPRCR